MTKAKEILKAIRKEANNRKTYYVITKIFWPYGSWEQRIADELKCNDDIWKDVYRLNERYIRFKDYVNEQKPNWKVIDIIHYADNSTEAIERNDQGDTRKRMITAPYGDIC